jgi:hypothetical protein
MDMKAQEFIPKSEMSVNAQEFNVQGHRPRFEDQWKEFVPFEYQPQG